MQHKSFHSHILQRPLNLPVTAHALRCIEKYGGIDGYLMYVKPARLADSLLAQRLRQELVCAWQVSTGLKWRRREVIFLQQLRDSLAAERERRSWEQAGQPGEPPAPFRRRHWIPYDLAAIRVHDPHFEAQAVYRNPRSGRSLDRRLTLTQVPGTPALPPLPVPDYLLAFSSSPSPSESPSNRLIEA